MSIAEIKLLPILNYQNIPECLRELATLIETGKVQDHVNNVLVLVSSPGEIHPALYSFGNFDAVRDVGIMQSAIHDVLTCRTPFRPQMEKK